MGRELEDAALAGDLGHFFPTELLQLMRLAQATGRLDLKRPRERAELYVERGHPMFARTSGGSVRAGEILVHMRLLSTAALERALAEQKSRPGERLGAVLVARGDVTPEQVLPVSWSESRRNGLLRRISGLQYDGLMSVIRTRS